MSKPNPKRAAKSSTRKTRDAENDESVDRSQSRSAVPPTTTKTLKPSDADAKDDAASGSGAAGGGATDGNDVKTDGDASTTPTEKPKPPSAGTTLRDASQKLLNITIRSDWNSIDAVLKQMEKIIAANGEAYTNPLTGVKDPVSMTLHIQQLNIMSNCEFLSICGQIFRALCCVYIA